MTVLIPAAAELVSYLVGISASYQALQAQEIDPRFRQPADALLATVGRDFVFQQIRIEYSRQSLITVRNYLEVARHITERAPDYADHWKLLLHQSPDLKRELWEHIEAAAQGFVQAGYDVHATPEAPGAWAASVLEKKRTPAPATATVQRPVTEPSDLGLRIRRVGLYLSRFDYKRAVKQIHLIRKQSSGAAVRNSNFYFKVLADAYPKTPFGSRIRDVIADELEASGRKEALLLFEKEPEKILAYYCERLALWEKAWRWRLLWKFCQAVIRYHRMNRRLLLPP